MFGRINTAQIDLFIEELLLHVSPYYTATPRGSNLWRSIDLPNY